MSIAFVVLAALVAVSTAFAVVAPRRPQLVGFLAWVFGLLPNELPFLAMAWSAVLVVGFGVAGVLDTTIGVAGLVLLAVAFVGQVELARRSAAAGPAVRRALDEALGPDGDAVAPRVALGPVLLKPFMARRRDVDRVADIAYGEHGVRNRLDVYARDDRPQGAPVLVYLHGGAWVSGKKDRQGLPIVYRLASEGWVCVAPNYRLGPDATFPDQLDDVMGVLAWVREHVAEHGGDPATIFVAGGSAGAHLAALAALHDTTLAGAIPLYGDYDWLDTNGERARRRLDRTKFLVDNVLKCTADADRALWERGSPLFQVRPDAPPFFVVHGRNDTLLLVEDTRHFVARLRATSTSPVAYAELPGGQHAFDGFQSVRCGHVVEGVVRFTRTVLSTRGSFVLHTEHGGPA